MKKFFNSLLTNKIVYYFILTVLISIFFYSLYTIGFWVYENYKNNQVKQELLEIAEIQPEEQLIPVPAVEKSKPIDINSISFLNTNVDYFYNQNNDTVGFIKVAGTYIEYSIVQSQDNLFYLNNNFKKQQNRGGWIFADYRNNILPALDDNVVVLGHMRNDGSMFSSLSFFLRDDFVNKYENHFIWVNTKTQHLVYRVFSVYRTFPTDSFNTLNFSSKADFIEFSKSVRKKNKMTIFNEYEVNHENKIITLFTCYNNSKERLVVHGELVKSENIS